MTRPLVLVARLDSDGDVLLAGPAVRAVAARARVLLLCGPRGQHAGDLLPGVADLLVWRCPWIDPEPPPVSAADLPGLVETLASRQIDAAVILTSFHQSPLPLAVLLRLAGIPQVSATSDDYPGSLLDVRHQPPAGARHEVERMLSLVGAAGFPLPPGDNGRLTVGGPLPDPSPLVGNEPYVVVHPGASVPARAPSPRRSAKFVAALVAASHRVVVTGGPADRSLTALVAGPAAEDLGGRTDLGTLAGVLAGARAVVAGNTGPAHLAAAVGTPVVSLFAPTVPAERWRPWQVPHVLLGDQRARCAGSRARTCPVPGHPCLDTISAEAVVDAVAGLMAVPLPNRPKEGAR